LPEGNPQALYELASAYDSTGHPAEAAPLYRRAFASGLTGSKHRQAVIQLAATLRTLGESEESVALLTAERERASDELDADVSAFLALALVDVGREREATALDFIADYLFRPDGGLVSRELAESDPNSFVVGQFITLYDPGVLFVGYAGKKIDAVRAAVDRGLARAHTPLSPQAFAAARLAFEYNLLHELQTPTEIADNFGWYTIQGNPGYAPGAGGRSGAYFKAADSLTPEFVAAVADKYLSVPPVVATLRPQTAPEPAK